MGKLLFGFLIISFALSGWSDDRFQIANVETVITDVSQQKAQQYFKILEENKTEQSVIGKLAEQFFSKTIDLDYIINMGEKIIKFIENRSAVLHVEFVNAHALPAGANVQMLTGWKGPVIKQFEVTMKNLWGITVIQLKYEIAYLYGGSVDVDGNARGQYLGNIAFIPNEVYVAPMWEFNATGIIKDEEILNVGTAKDPIALAQIHVIYDSPGLAATSSHYRYIIKGDGTFQNPYQ